MELQNPSGVCLCGCGQPAPIATMTNRRHGHVAGQHMRYIRGHVGFLKRRTRLGPDQWTEEDRGFATPCWIWRGKPRDGYGRVKFQGRVQLPHRAMYEQEVGPIPAGLDLDHLCRQPTCCNPEHLEPVTRAENIRRSRTAKLTAADVILIRASSLTQHRIAAIFGVSRQTIGEIRRGEIWRD